MLLLSLPPTFLGHDYCLWCVFSLSYLSFLPIIFAFLFSFGLLFSPASSQCLPPCLSAIAASGVFLAIIFM
ncbi:hypothetical protein JB92DRAFT_2908934, partial [Gautieria morchelliformis]